MVHALHHHHQPSWLITAPHSAAVVRKDPSESTPRHDLGPVQTLSAPAWQPSRLLDQGAPRLGLGGRMWVCTWPGWPYEELWHLRHGAGTCDRDPPESNSFGRTIRPGRVWPVGTVMVPRYKSWCGDLFLASSPLPRSPLHSSSHGHRCDQRLLPGRMSGPARTLRDARGGWRERKKR